MRRFQFKRVEDETGISGTGIVAEGAVLSSDKVVVSWLTKIPTISIYERMADAEFLHGHDGKTKTIWLDPPPKTWHCFKCGNDTRLDDDAFRCVGCKEERWNE
jgi:hypothetical protein